MTDVPPEKLQAYHSTHYRIGSGDTSFVLRIGEHSAALQREYERMGTRCCVFITAMNPFGRKQSDAANEKANAQLKSQLQCMDSLIIEGEGVDPTGQWPPEQSFLAFGIDDATAEKLGRQFKQDAVVFVGADAVPRLLLTR